MRFIILLLATGIAICSQAQQNIFIKITGGEEKNPVSASLFIKEITKHYSTDSTGIISLSFEANGTYTAVVTATGYEEKETQFTIPLLSDTLEIELEESEHEMDEIIIQSTRTSRTIANVPTRVETIEWEEIDEKNNMRPANVAMLLHESTGIQVQQTSATSGNASIRIQGLDGRYTQLLKDGFANFANFASGLSVLEIPPLDLQQVEIIKGPASPLFGGGAIAGVVNFISKTPQSKPQYHFLLNQSNIGQTNVGGFASGRNKKTGYTLLTLYSRQKTYDVDGDDFTEVPKSYEITAHPKLFFYPNTTTTIIIGNSFTKGERTGGDVEVINNKADAFHQYFEKNITLRNVSTLELEKQTGDNKRFSIKQSFNVFDRTITVPSYIFSGVNYNGYTDISYVVNTTKHAVVIGGNFIYDQFKEDQNNSGNRDNKTLTGGVYGQHTLNVSEKLKLESGLRLDASGYSNAIYSNNEFFVLPRVSLLVAYNSKWSSRIGGGIGYKTPTLFTEQTETMQYRDVEQLNNVTAERSYGATGDINFRTRLDNDLLLTFNQMFFYTQIDNPLVLSPTSSGTYRFANMYKNILTAGFETNARFIFKENFKIFLGYTFTHTEADYLTGNTFLPLVPKHKLNSALIYEKEGAIKLGLEGYFTGKQHLSDGSTTPSFKELGFMAEKIFRKFSLYVNFENFTDTRQSRYKNVVNGSHLAPTFDEIWTHTEGFVFNGGIKIRL